MTFEEALNIMKNKYEELTLETVYPESDVGLKFSALAAVLSGLSADIEDYSKQLSPYTATGKWLDAFAAEYGLSRKAATKATGTVEIVPVSVLSEAATVPAGTVIMTDGLNPLYFLTDSAVTLDSSNLRATVSVTAKDGGKALIPANKLCRFCAEVSPFITVFNGQIISSGADAESDGELRKRVLDFYEAVPFSNNASAVRSRVLQFDGIEKASVQPDSGLYNVYVKWNGEGSLPSDTIAAFIAQSIPSASYISVSAGSSVTADISVTVKSPSTNASSDITAAITRHINSLDFGEKLLISKLYEIISSLECCESFTVGDISTLQSVTEQSYYTAGTVTVTEG